MEDEAPDFDFDAEFVKANSTLELAVTNLRTADPTAPGIRAWLQNYLLPTLNRMMALQGANRAMNEEVNLIAQQALAMSERTLAGETLSFLVPGCFAFEKYLATYFPDAAHPLRQQFNYLLSACAPVREIYSEQLLDVEAAFEQFIARAADDTSSPASGDAQPTSESPPATSP